MVYWNDIPSDSNFVSPFHPSRIPRDDSTADYNEEQEEEEKFLSFEPDRAGWNNMRMSFETVVVLAAATGRTLVIPNEKKITQESLRYCLIKCICLFNMRYSEIWMLHLCLLCLHSIVFASH